MILFIFHICPNIFLIFHICPNIFVCTFQDARNIAFGEHGEWAREGTASQPDDWRWVEVLLWRSGFNISVKSRLMKVCLDRQKRRSGRATILGWSRRCAWVKSLHFDLWSQMDINAVEEARTRANIMAGVREIFKKRSKVCPQDKSHCPPHPRLFFTKKSDPHIFALGICIYNGHN